MALIAAELVRINALVRANESREYIAGLAEILSDELAGYSLETIRAAMREHPRRCAWMPKLSELLTLCNQAAHQKAIEKQREAAGLPMPGELSEQQRQLNLNLIAKLRDKLANQKRIKTR